MSGVNVVYFKGIKNIAIKTYRGIYKNMADFQTEKDADFYCLYSKDEKS